MKAKSFFPILLLLAISLIIFGKIINFEFLTFDDNIYITENPAIASDTTTWKDCFLYKYGNPDFFPIPNLIFRAERTLFGFDSQIFHGFNLLIYLINIVLVYLLSLKLFPRFGIDDKLKKYFSFFVALFFAIHPIHVESATWIIDLKDLLSSAFYMLGMMSYINWLEKKNNKHIWATLIFAFLSMYSKSSGITFIGTLFLLDWLYKLPLVTKEQSTKIPFVAILLYGLYTFGFFSPSEGLNVFSKEIAESPIVYYPPSIEGLPPILQRFFMVIFRVVYWIIQSIFPSKQTVLYSRDLLLKEYSDVIIVFPILLIAIGVFVFLNRNKIKVAFWGLCFYLITLTPTLLQSDMGISVFVPDRYLYFPLLGILFVFIGLVFYQKKWLTRIILVAFTIFWGYKTVTYLPVWQNSDKLYERALKYDPNCTTALSNRLNLHLERDSINLALKDLNKLAELNHPNSTIYINRGKIMLDRKQYESALLDFQKALYFDSLSVEGYTGLGRCYFLMDSLENSRNTYSKAYDLDSTNYLLNKNIAALYHKAGNFPIAIMFCDKCLLQNPEDFDLLSIQAHSYFHLRKYNRSNKYIQKATQIDSSNATLWYMRHIIYKNDDRDSLANIYLKNALKFGYEAENLNTHEHIYN